MIRSALVWLGFLIFVGETAGANPIVVRSGEHESFTRLVMELPEAATWELNSQDGKSTITLQNFSDGFDLTNAFNIIPRTRLVALVARESFLELQLSCECPVIAFMDQGSFLVLDIADGPPLIPEERNGTAQVRVPESSFTYGDLLWSPREAVRPTEPPLVQTNQETGDDAATTSEETSEDIVRETQERLLRAFADAASRGIVDHIGSLPDTDTAENSQRSVPELFDSSTLPQTDQIPTTGNIRISNSGDVPLENNNLDIGLSGNTCVNPDLVNISAWGDATDFGAQLGASNTNLFDELGRVIPTEALRRAKLYVFFGFGAEAKEALDLVPGLSDRQPEIVDIANILEHGYARNPRSLHRFADCDSDLALWGILAAQNTPLEREINAHPALLALEKLPNHLKFFLAQELSKRFVARGDVVNANVAIRMFERLEEQSEDSPKIVEAQTQALEEKDKQSEATLKDVISEASDEAPDALVLLIDSHVKRNIPVPADLVLLAEAYAFELRNSDGEAKMVRSLILASGKSGQFSKAFEVLGSEVIQNDPTVRIELTNFLFLEMANTLEDSLFLSGFFQFHPDNQSDLEPKTTLEISKKLFALGFHEKAYELLETAPADYKPAELRVLMAKILIEENQYEQALSEVLGLNGMEASLVRARALEQLGDDLGAIASYEDADNLDSALSASWLSDNWSQLVDPDDPLYGSVQRLNAQSVDDVLPNENMLSETQAAIDNSLAARTALQQLLETLEITE